MPKIVVRHQNKTVAEFPLHPGMNSIGRLPTHTVSIENLGISRNHAFILADRDEKIFVLEDLKSLNGTYVNKKRIEKYLLRHGDVITIGQHILEFRQDETQAANAGIPSAEDSSPGDSKPGSAWLEDLSNGKKIVLDKETVFFGNSSADDIPIPGIMVGKNFASLNLKGSTWIANLLVKRFSHLRINGEDVVSAKLRPGDILDVAGFRFKLMPAQGLGPAAEA